VVNVGFADLFGGEARALYDNPCLSLTIRTLLNPILFVKEKFRFLGQKENPAQSPPGSLHCSLGFPSHPALPG
jgi:hypothetical protein